MSIANHLLSVLSLVPALSIYLAYAIECLALKKHEAIVVPLDMDIKKVINNLDNTNNLIFINIDEEVNNVLKGKQLTQLLDLPNSKEAYLCVREVILSIINLLDNGCISKGKQIIFISTDYHLIKAAFLRNVNIMYTLPSSAHVVDTTREPSINIAKYNLIANDLKNRKMGKLKIYNNQSDLEYMIMNRYNASRKI